MNNKIALNKWLAHIGLASRRKSTELIKNQKVSVNNQIVNQPFTPINPQADHIKVNGKTITSHNMQFEYYLLNKPVGYVSAAQTDSSGLPPVTHLIKTTQRIYPIGRLDIASQGLLILTNDGELTHQLTHPKFHATKHYLVEVAGQVTSKKIDQLESGISLKEGQTASARVQLLTSKGNTTTLEFIITEGKYRQIRRMCAAVDLHVKKLTRTQINNLKIGNLMLGEYRSLSPQEINLLKQIKAEP